jgi:hypothetical protein
MPGTKPGRATITQMADGAQLTKVYVNDNGGSDAYKTGPDQNAINISDLDFATGDVAFVNWNSDRNCLELLDKGTKAAGKVNDYGNQFTVTNAGDTGLSGTVFISIQYGLNEGFGGLNAYAVNAGGEAAYLTMD